MSIETTNICQDEVLKWLPHRDPFLLIDRATDFHDKQSLIGHYELSEDASWFQGHFPGNPVMPGVLLIESMAQTGALLAAKSWRIYPENSTIVFSTVSKAKFRFLVKPGDSLEMHVKIQGRKRDYIQYEAKVMVQQKIAASCMFMATMVKKST